MRSEPAGSRVLAWLGLAVALGLLGAALDQFHVQSGLLTYPETAWWDQAWWVPLNFAVLLTSLVAITIAVVRAGLVDASPPGNGRLVAGLAWFAGAYGLSAALAPDHPDLLAAAYVLAWLPRVLSRPRAERSFLVAYGVGLALAGCTVEAIEIGLGWFSYAEPQVAGVPLWLAGIYLHGSPLALDVSRRLSPSASERRSAA
jgi:hypothetical protein